MCKQHQNIYRFARENAGLTREQAAEALNLSVKSIQAFEDGITGCCAYVMSMSKAYDAPELPIQHLTHACQIGLYCLPEIENRDAPLAVIHINREIRGVQEMAAEIEIATCEGTVTRLSNIRKKVSGLVAAGLSFLHCSTKLLKKKRNTRAVTQVFR